MSDLSTNTSDDGTLTLETVPSSSAMEIALAHEFQLQTAVNQVSQHRYCLECQHGLLREALSGMLAAQGWKTAAEADVTLIVDLPTGRALADAERHRKVSCLVLTENPCPEYLLDLLGFGIPGLILHCHDHGEVVRALEEVRAGRGYVRPRSVASQLSDSERRSLRMVAQALEHGEVARRVGVKPGVLRNRLSNVLGKLRAAHPHLEFASARQLSAYYWGMWDQLAADDVDHVLGDT